MTNDTAPARGLIVSVGDSRKCTNWRGVQMTWEELTKRLRSVQRTSETVQQFANMSTEERSNVKDVGGFIGGSVRNGSRKASDVDFRQLVTLDADYAGENFWRDFVMLNEYTACIYSTHSHRAGHQRLRLIIPLTRTVDPVEYEAVSRRVAADIGIDLFDDTTYEPNRLMYWPSCPIDGEFVYEEQEGDWLDPDEVLARYDDWRDEAEWPVSSRTETRIRSHASEQGVPTDKPGFIGAFCRVYDIPAAIQTYLADVYKPEQEGRYTFIGGSTFGGVKLFDNNTFMYSWHSTDPVHGRLLNAFDLVRLHKYGSLDEGTTAADMHDTPSYKAMLKLCSEDVDVMREYRETKGGDADAVNIVFANQFADQDVAKMIGHKYDGKLLFNASIGWIGYDGKVWRGDAESQAVHAVERTNNELLEEIDIQCALADDGQRKELEKRRTKIIGLRSANRISGLVRMSKAELQLYDVGRLDPDGEILNTPDYMINLQTGERLVHDPKRMCTHVTTVSPSDEPAPMWQKFLNDVTQGDEDLKRYVQTVCGMALYGKVLTDGMVIVYGPGGNGKSTMFEVISKVLGDYAATMRPEILVPRNNGSEPYGIEECRGRRLVLMGETDEGARMNVSMMKRLTSRDFISANPKHKQPFSFMPTHTLVLHTNYLPRLGQLDDGTKRRITVIPFMAPRREGAQCIAGYADIIYKQQGAQVLKWMIDGAKEYARCVKYNGGYIPKPECVKAATDSYIGNEDWMKLFIEDECVVGQTCTAMGGDLFARYKSWANDNNEYAKRSRDFMAELERRGFERKRTNKGSIWSGIGLAGQS